MSDFVEHSLCENFEANVFAKSRCQNCFRALGAHHQPSNQSYRRPACDLFRAVSSERIPARATQWRESGADRQATRNLPPCCSYAGKVPEEHAVEAPHSDATSGPVPGGLWDPLCILAPQCELYVCAGVEDRTEGWQESLAYTQLSSRAQGKHGETSTSTGTSATLSGEWEMTRLLDSILGSDKQDMMNYMAQRKEVQAGALQSDRPRSSQTISCGSWGRTESQSFRKEISPQKAESSPVSQSAGDGRGKHQMESSYFSLERRKSDPTWVSSPPRASHSALHTHRDPVRTGRRLTSSISSLDSDLPACTSGSSEGRHGLVRQEYTVLADLPKPKRISHREAFEQERSSSRTRSPGRAEVERIFGYERRKSETLEAFQALEEGLLDRLDGKTPLLAKEGRLGRRQSSPTLYSEGNKRLPQQLKQPGKGRGEALRSVSPARQSERDWRSRVASMCHMSTDKSMGRERGPLQPSNPGKNTDSNWKTQRDSLRPTSPGKSSDNSWAGRRGHLCSVSPGKHTESNWKSPRETQPVGPVTSTERKWKGVKEPLHPMSAGKHTSARQSLEKKPHPVSLGKCTERDQKSWGKSLRPVSPAAKPERDWRSQAETLRPRSPTRQPERNWRSQAEILRPVSPAGKPERDWRSQAETPRPRSPSRQLERDWRSQAETLRSRSPAGKPERNWRCREEALCSRSQTQRSEDNWKTQEECLCHMNPKQQLERDWRSHGECMSSENQPETTWKSPASPRQWSESDWKSQEQSLDLSPEKQLEDDRGKEETLLHHSQLDRGTSRPLNSASSMGSQDLYLNTNGQRNKGASSQCCGVLGP